MKNGLFFLVLNYLCVGVYGQVNLVKNPSFEQYSHCPTNINQIAYARYWNGIDTIWVPGSSDTTGLYMSRYLPDFVNLCGTYPYASVPNNTDFHHYPRTGNGMVQQQMFYNYYWGYSVGVPFKIN